MSNFIKRINDDMSVHFGADEFWSGISEKGMQIAGYG